VAEYLDVADLDGGGDGELNATYVHNMGPSRHDYSTGVLYSILKLSPIINSSQFASEAE
jgi:hypothetical protein